MYVNNLRLLALRISKNNFTRFVSISLKVRAHVISGALITLIGHILAQKTSKAYLTSFFFGSLLKASDKLLVKPSYHRSLQRKPSHYSSLFCYVNSFMSQ